MVLLYFYWKYRADFQQKMDNQPAMIQESGASIITRMVRLALPVSLANIMLPVVSNIDLLIVPPRLEVAGYTVEQATELFGYLTGMAVPLVNMATILTASLAASLVPSISEANTLGDRAAIFDRTATAIRIANLITIPAFVGMWLLATPISQMLYATPNAGVSIAISSLGIFLLGIHQVTTGVLQGLGRTAIPVVNMVISAGVKVVLGWTLTAMPQWGIKGAAWASNADFGVAALVNMWFIYKLTGYRIHMDGVLKPLFAAAAMGLAVQVILLLTPTWRAWSILLAMLVAVPVYGFSLLKLGGVSRADLEMLPFVGRKLLGVCQKLGYFRDGDK